MVKTVIDKLMRWRDPAALVVVAALVLLALMGVINLITYSFTASFTLAAGIASSDFGSPVLTLVLALLVLACLVEPATKRSQLLARSAVLVIGISLAMGLLLALIGYVVPPRTTSFFGYVAERLVAALALLVVVTVRKALPATVPKAGRADAAGQHPGQGYPGQGYPGQNYPGQGQSDPGQNYPGQNYPGQNYPAQNGPDQGQAGGNYPSQGQAGQGYPGQAGQSYPNAPQPGAQNYPGQTYGAQTYGGQSEHGRPTSQPSASRPQQRYGEQPRPGWPASAQSAGYREGDRPTQPPANPWGSTSYSQPDHAFPPPSGPASTGEYPQPGQFPYAQSADAKSVEPQSAGPQSPDRQSSEHQSPDQEFARNFDSGQYGDEQVRQFGPRRSHPGPDAPASIQSHAAPAGAQADGPEAGTDHDASAADDQTRTMPAVDERSATQSGTWDAPSPEDDHGRAADADRPDHQRAPDESGPQQGNDRQWWNGPQS